MARVIEEDGVEFEPGEPRHPLIKKPFVLAQIMVRFGCSWLHQRPSTS